MGKPEDRSKSSTSTQVMRTKKMPNFIKHQLKSKKNTLLNKEKNNSIDSFKQKKMLNCIKHQLKPKKNTLLNKEKNNSVDSFNLGSCLPLFCF